MTHRLGLWMLRCVWSVFSPSGEAPSANVSKRPRRWAVFDREVGLRPSAQLPRGSRFWPERSAELVS